MSRFNTQRLNAAGAVQKELATPNVISREQARLYSQAVRLDWQVSGLPTRKSDEAERKLLDAERLIEAGRILKDLGTPEQASSAYRRAGDLLEWLSRSSGSTNHPKMQTVPLALLAMASFQLAGYPAMARGLLSQKRLPTATENMFAAFLRGFRRRATSLPRLLAGSSGNDWPRWRLASGSGRCRCLRRVYQLGSRSLPGPHLPSDPHARPGSPEEEPTQIVRAGRIRSPLRVRGHLADSVANF